MIPLQSLKALAKDGPISKFPWLGGPGDVKVGGKVVAVDDLKNSPLVLTEFETIEQVFWGRPEKQQILKRVALSHEGYLHVANAFDNCAYQKLIRAIILMKFILSGDIITPDMWLVDAWGCHPDIKVRWRIVSSLTLTITVGSFSVTPLVYARDHRNGHYYTVHQLLSLTDNSGLLFQCEYTDDAKINEFTSQLRLAHAIAKWLNSVISNKQFPPYSWGVKLA